MFYDARNRQELQSLDPIVAERVRAFLKRLEAIGEDVLITDGFRSKEEQDVLYARGRSKPGDIVTWVRGGDSLHNYGCAIDLVPVRYGLPQWRAYDRYQTIAIIAKELGFEWGYSLWSLDMPHFHYTQGLTLDDLKAGERPRPIQPGVTINWDTRNRSDLRKADRIGGMVGEMIRRMVLRRIDRLKA